MAVIGGLDRHHDDMAMAHPALGDDVVGERLHVGAASLQHRHFQAVGSSTWVGDLQCLDPAPVVPGVLGGMRPL